MELRENTSEPEQQKKQASEDARLQSGSAIRLIAKPVLITLVIVAGVVGLIFLWNAVTHEEDESDFLNLWKEIVESGDAQAYEEICSEEFKENSRDSYEYVRDLIATEEISTSVEHEGIEKIRLDNDHYVIKHIPMFLSRADVKTHEELEIKRKGLLSPKWEIVHEGPHFSVAAGDELEQIAEAEPAESLFWAGKSGFAKQRATAEPDEAPLDTDYRVRQTLEVWRTAWNDKDLDGYIACYADYADITRVTVAGGKEKRAKLTKSKLREHMERLNKKYEKIQVGINNLRVEGDTATAEANFLQEYAAWGLSAKGPVYHDIGVKELQFVKHDVEWKITNENWIVYKEVPIYPEREISGVISQ